MSDLNQLLALDLSKATTRAVFMTDKDGKESGVFVLSSDSPQAKAEQDRQRIAASKTRAERGGKLLDTENSEEDKAEFQQMLAASFVSSALAVTTGWFGFEKDGKPMEYDPKVMAQLYAKFAGWPKFVIGKSDGNVNNFLPQP